MCYVHNQWYDTSCVTLYVTVVLFEDDCILLTLTLTAHSWFDPLTDLLIGGLICLNWKHMLLVWCVTSCHIFFSFLGYRQNI